MKSNIAVFSLFGLLLCCTPQDEMITRPDTQTSPGIVEIEYPKALPEEMYTESPNPRKYAPIEVFSMGTSLPHDWASKAVSRKTRVVAMMKDYTPAYTAQEAYDKATNQYGSSLLLPRQKATGRWRTQKVDGRWWLVDPEGYLNVYRGLTTLNCEDAAMVSRVYGDDTQWAKMTVRQMAELGFHGAGGFSADDKLQKYNNANAYLPITQTPKPNFLSGTISLAGYSVPENESCRVGVVFNEDFPEQVMKFAPGAIKAYVGKSYVLGVMSDNELCFSANGVDVLKEMLSLSDDSFAGKVAAKKLLEDHGLEPTAEAYLASPEKNQLLDEYSGQMAEIYFKSCHDAIKAVDPDMLYLGARLHGKPKTQKSVIEAAGRWCDVITINYYGDWTPDLLGKVASWKQWADAPFMVTEFYTLSEDTGMTNSSGAGFLVKTTLEKGFFYQHFTLALLEATNCVGWTWFRYMDHENSNNGLFNLRLQVYPEFATLARELNYNAYDLIKYFDN